MTVRREPGSAPSTYGTPLVVSTFWRSLRLLLLLIFYFTGGPVGTAELPEALKSAGPAPEAVDRLVCPLLRHAEGALVIGFTDGCRHHVLAYGHPGDQKETKPDAFTIFEIGSLTKIFTSLLLVDLWRENSLSLDDPVGKFMPDDVNVPAYQGKQVTLFQLATHTSGLPRDPDNYLPHETLPYGKEQFHQFLEHCRLTTPPGKKYLYSNAGYTLLGEALENAGQASYWQLLKSRVLHPLKLFDTVIVLDRERLNRLASGHDRGGKKIENSPLSGGPSGGLKSTANDLLLLLDTAISKPDTALAADFQTACKRRVRCFPSEFACLGWFYNSDSGSFYKSGQVDGFSACLEFSPSRRQGIVVLSATLQVNAETLLKRCAALQTAGRGWKTTGRQGDPQTGGR